MFWRESKWNCQLKKKQNVLITLLPERSLTHTQPALLLKSIPQPPAGAKIPGAGGAGESRLRELLLEGGHKQAHLYSKG